MKIYKYHYVYRITNLITKMYYYGDRSCNCYPSEDIGKNYFSSFTNSLFETDQKDNPQDYKYKIIKIFETCRKDAKQLEVDLHKKFDVKNHPKFINRANQTSSGFQSTTQSIQKGLISKYKINPKTGKSSIDQMKEKQRDRMMKIDKITGKTIAQLTAEKTVMTKNKIDIKTGKTIHQISGKLSKKSRLNNIDEEGLNGFERTGKKVSSWNKQVNPITGLTNAQEKANKAAITRIKNKTGGMKKALNPSSKIIDIFDKFDNILFTAHGNIKDICLKNNLPYEQITFSYRKGIILYDTPRGRKAAIRNNREFLIGGYAQVRL